MVRNCDLPLAEMFDYLKIHSGLFLNVSLFCIGSDDEIGRFCSKFSVTLP